MIKFFRKIRQNLLNEGKTTKYFKYAIGEIVLVVLGILIALSINNWNDARKDRITEKELYRTLIKSLESDLEDVRTKSMILDTALTAQRIFITESLAEVKSKFTDEEIYRMIWQVGNTSYSFVPNVSLYTKISQNQQIDLIQSDSLQKKVIDLFELHYWEYKDLDMTLERLAQEGLISNFFGDIAHLVIKNQWETDDATLQKQYDELNKDCRKIYFLSMSVKKSMLNCESSIEALLPLLKDELIK
ncbi:DUF6090 family protein [Maribacter arcticus]|jgi:hypothetical protein|uniref:DUF6090 family protein n=1 Tax=Maribacter arcticus TaxID=561365 RepID=UPI0030027ADB